MMEVSCYAFYGTLRRGMYNFEIYKEHLQFLSTNTLAGFKLFALPKYPIAIRTNSDKDTIVVELFKVSNLDIEQEIHAMEMSAGYYFDSVEIDGLKAGIFLFKEALNCKEIPDGDWVKYFANRLDSE